MWISEFCFSVLGNRLLSRGVPELSVLVSSGTPRAQCGFPSFVFLFSEIVCFQGVFPTADGPFQRKIY
jgi:hypothetical protein